MHKVLMFFVVVIYIHLAYLPIFLRAASLALEQSHDCPSTSKVTLKNMGKIDLYQSTAQ